MERLKIIRNINLTKKSYPIKLKKAICTTNSKIQDILKHQVEDHHQVQADHHFQAAFPHPGFLILHTDTSHRHTLIYHLIMAHMEGTCSY